MPNRLSQRSRILLAGAGVGVVLLLAVIAFLVISPGKTSGTQADLSRATVSVATQPGLTGAGAGGDEYLALGDSVAFGVGASSPEQLGYPSVFYQKYLKKAQPDFLTYRNFAIPGETAASFISRPKSKSQLERAIEEIELAQKVGRKVKLVTLTIGGNDVITARGKSELEKTATLAQFDTNLQKILAQLAPRLSAIQADFIITTYYNPFGSGTTAIEKADNNWALRFNDTIKKRAEEYKLKVADFYQPISGNEKSLTWIERGDIHPNGDGHTALAMALWQATGYTLPSIAR